MPMSILGLRIRTIRRQQQRTQQQIAEACGCTKGLVSKIEAGKCQPTLAMLTKIARALGVTASALLDEEETAATVYTPAEALHAADWPRTDKGYAYYAFAAGRTDKTMQPFLITARRGQVTPHGLTHAGDEFVYVLEGEMAYRVGDQTYHLRPGDSLYFNALDTHDLTPLTERVTYLAIFSPPQ